jgi:glucuronokinase
MNIIRKRAYARAGLLGNPSDGYHGKTISIIVRNFWAEVVLYEWDSVDIVLTEEDRAHFNSIYDLAKDVKLHGYYGGIRIIKATIKRFVEYCQANQLVLHNLNFSVRYQTNIPRQVGLAGSSALITATLRCLMEFYDIQISQEALPTLVLSVENDELGISGGLQDRVIQVYEGLVYMDFDARHEHVVGGLKCYKYESLSHDLLPTLYIAYHTNLSEPTEVFHNDIRGRFNAGEEKVVQAMKHFADIAATGRDALLNRNPRRLSELMDENFNTRRGIYNLAAWQIQMVEVARQCGASAKFAGSGGAIIGIYQGEGMYNELCTKLSAIGSRVIKPELA